MMNKMLWKLLVPMTIFYSLLECRDLMTPKEVSNIISGKPICGYGTIDIHNAQSSELLAIAIILYKKFNYFIDKSCENVLKTVIELLGNKTSIFCLAISKNSSLRYNLSNSPASFKNVVLKNQDLWKFLGTDLPNQLSLKSHVEIAISIDNQNPVLRVDFFGLKSFHAMNELFILQYLQQNYNLFVQFIQFIRTKSKVNDVHAVIKIIENYAKLTDGLFNPYSLILGVKVFNMITEAFFSFSFNLYFSLLFNSNIFETLQSNYQKKKIFSSSLPFDVIDSDNLNPSFFYLSNIFKSLKSKNSYAQIDFFYSRSSDGRCAEISKMIGTNLKLSWGKPTKKNNHIFGIIDFFFQSIKKDLNCFPRDNERLTEKALSATDDKLVEPMEDTFFNIDFMANMIFDFNRLCYVSFDSDVSFYKLFIKRKVFSGLLVNEEKFRDDFPNLNEKLVSSELNSLFITYSKVPKQDVLKKLFGIFADPKTWHYKHLVIQPDVAYEIYTFNCNLNNPMTNQIGYSKIIPFLLQKTIEVLKNSDGIWFNYEKFKLQSIEFNRFHSNDFFELLINTCYYGEQSPNLRTINFTQWKSHIPSESFLNEFVNIMLTLKVNRNQPFFTDSTDIHDRIFILFQLLAEKSYFSAILFKNTLYKNSSFLTTGNNSQRFVKMILTKKFWTDFSRLFNYFIFVWDG